MGVSSVNGTELLTIELTSWLLRRSCGDVIIEVSLIGGKTTHNIGSMGKETTHLIPLARRDKGNTSVETTVRRKEGSYQRPSWDLSIPLNSPHASGPQVQANTAM